MKQNKPREAPATTSSKKCCDNDDDDYPNCDSENTIKCRKGKICVDPCFKSSTCNDNYPLT